MIRDMRGWCWILEVREVGYVDVCGIIAVEQILCVNELRSA